MVFRMLEAAEIEYKLFAGFERQQAVTHCLRLRDGVWRPLPVAFTDDWSRADYAALTGDLKRAAQNGGAVIGAFHAGRLKGFACIDGARLRR